MRTSSLLAEGVVYSRRELVTMFQIGDATVRNGVFHPKGHDSVWLFVTEKKTPADTPYRDMLAGDTLWWDGQAAGRTDRLIIEHEAHGLELLLFYRHTKDEHPDSGFAYEGRFRYVSHTAGIPEDRLPSRFVLKRVRTSA